MDDTSLRSIKTKTTTRTFDLDRAAFGQVVLVFQGGGALGAYQAGVYQALHEAGVEPDWVIGTSIGAINASLIAGNPPEKRLARLREFWLRMRHSPLSQLAGATPMFGPFASNVMTVVAGVRGFFEPNPWAFFGMGLNLGAEAIPSPIWRRQSFGGRQTDRVAQHPRHPIRIGIASGAKLGPNCKGTPPEPWPPIGGALSVCLCEGPPWQQSMP